MKTLTFILALATIIASCNKTSHESDLRPKSGKVGVKITFSNYFFHVESLPLDFYVDDQKILTYGNSALLTPVGDADCYGRKVDFGVEIKDTGNHKFAFVTPDNHYIDGTFTISAGQCTYIPLSEDQFSGSKTNYGTNKGRLTFIRTRLPMGNTGIYVDNNLIGTLTSLPYHQICGVGNGVANIIIDLSPGNHQYKAVDYTNNLQWIGTTTISPNGCTVITF